MKTLTPQEIESLLVQQPEWTLTEGKLVREWSLNDFRDAMLLVNKVAAISESLNHHPDIDIRYNKVRLALWTHDVHGITLRDSTMIARLRAVLP